MKELYLVTAIAGVDRQYADSIDEDLLLFDICESEETAKEKANALGTNYENNPKAFINEYSRSKFWNHSEGIEYDYFYDFDVKKFTTGKANLIYGVYCM